MNPTMLFLTLGIFWENVTSTIQNMLLMRFDSRNFKCHAHFNNHLSQLAFHPPIQTAGYQFCPQVCTNLHLLDTQQVAFNVQFYLCPGGEGSKEMSNVIRSEAR